MAGNEADEEIAGIGSERAHAIAAFLHHERRVALLADHAAELLKVAGAVRPGAGRITARGVEAKRDDEEGRTEAPDAPQRLGYGVAVLLRRDVLGQRDVQIEAGAGTDPGLVAEAGEIGIGEARMAVDRDRQHVRPRIKDFLLAVAVVIVDVEDGNAVVAGEEVRSDSGVVEIAEAAEGPRLGVMAWRPHQRIGKVGAFEHLLRRGQRAIDGRTRGEIGVHIERREGVDAVVPGKYRLVLRRSRRVSRREHVRIDRLLGTGHEAGLADIVDEPAVMDGADVAVREPLRRQALEQAGRPELGHDRADADRRLDIAPILDMVDGVVVIDEKRDARF